MTIHTLFRPLFIACGCVVLLASSLSAAETAAPAKPAALPRLVDLGAGKCIPCKLMKPILDELSKNYADQFTVVFIDVWENREEGAKYGIRMIPTQVFYGADGKERARHEGFMSKEAILAKWKELGVEVKAPGAPTKS